MGLENQYVENKRAGIYRSPPLLDALSLASYSSVPWKGTGMHLSWDQREGTIHTNWPEVERLTRTLAKLHHCRPRSIEQGGSIRGV